MRCTLIIALVLVLLATGFDSRLTRVTVLGQTPTEEKPKLKDFGSSLKRLKWDPVKQAALETKGDAGKREGEPSEDDVVRVETQLVVWNVQVLDQRGRAVPGLTQNDFLVTEDNATQQISHFSLGDDVKVERSIVLIIDYSGSQFNYLDMSVEAAKMLVDKLGPKDRMAIVTDDVALLVDFSSDKTQLKQVLESLKAIVTDDVASAVGLSSDKTQLKQVPESLKDKPPPHRRLGRSAQFSALLATVKELVHVEDIRPIIIFQTDGDEVSFLQPPDPRIITPSFSKNAEFNQKLETMLRARVTEFSLSDVYAATEKSRTTVYTVIPGIRLLGLSSADQLAVARSRENEVRLIYGQAPSETKPVSDEALAAVIDLRVRQQSAASGVATLTGGWTSFLEEPKQAKDIYARILSDLNSRYVVGYYPSNKVHDGKRRKVLVQVRNHPEYTVEGRRSYFAPEPEQ